MGSYIFFLFIRNSYSIEYFSNPDIEPMLLSKVNGVASKFYSSLIFGGIYTLVLIPLFYKFPLHLRGHFLLPLIIMFLNDILHGVELMLHTDHFFSPEIATFSWSNSHQYFKYETKAMNYRFIFSMILIITTSYFYIKKIKSMKLQQKEQQNLDNESTPKTNIL